MRSHRRNMQMLQKICQFPSHVTRSLQCWM